LPPTSTLSPYTTLFRSFENALRAYVTDCLASAGCPLTGTVDDAMAQVKSLFDKILANPLPTSDPARPLTQTLAFYGIAQPLYSQDRKSTRLNSSHVKIS